jgi:hypothetical protein
MKILYLLWAGKYGLQEGQKKENDCSWLANYNMIGSGGKIYHFIQFPFSSI